MKKSQTYNRVRDVTDYNDLIAVWTFTVLADPILFEETAFILTKDSKNCYAHRIQKSIARVDL